MLSYGTGDTVSLQGGQDLMELAPLSVDGEEEKGWHRLMRFFSPFASDLGQENVANPTEDREILQRDLLRSRKYEEETIK